MRLITLPELLRIPPWSAGVANALRRIADQSPQVIAVSVTSVDGDPRATGWEEIPEAWPAGTVYAWIRSDADPRAADLPTRPAVRLPARCDCCGQVLRTPSPSTVAA